MTKQNKKTEEQQRKEITEAVLDVTEKLSGLMSAYMEAGKTYAACQQATAAAQAVKWGSADVLFIAKTAANKAEGEVDAALRTLRAAVQPFAAACSAVALKASESDARPDIKKYIANFFGQLQQAASHISEHAKNGNTLALFEVTILSRSLALRLEQTQTLNNKILEPFAFESLSALDAYKVEHGMESFRDIAEANVGEHIQISSRMVDMRQVGAWGDVAKKYIR